MIDDPGLPVKFGPCPNGEYDPEPLSPLIEETVARAGAAAGEAARRLGMTRREFLLSAAGTATTLLMLDRLTQAAWGSPHPPGGRYPIPPEVAVDPAAAQAYLGGDEFIFDLQGHLLEHDLNPATRDEWFWGRQFPQARCDAEEDPRACFTMEHFLEEIFLRSDTSMVALSGLPLLPEGSALSPEVMAETRRVVIGLSGRERVVVNALVLPTVAPLAAVLEVMEEAVAAFGVAGWKTFTHFPAGSGWWLDDHDPDRPQVGGLLLEKAVSTGRPIVCVHKGLSGGSRYASPEDVGPAAAAHPEVKFVVYHSGFEVGIREGPFTSQRAGVGVNRLIASLQRAGVGPNENVYAELGSTWWHLMRRPDEAAHVLGKLLAQVGERNVLWGTDSIFYGSPQDQIQAFRAFEISEDFQERFGYPALTADLKRKILGLNAARLYGVDPVVDQWGFTREVLAEARRTYPGPNRTYGPRTPSEVRAFRLHHQGWP